VNRQSCLVAALSIVCVLVVSACTGSSDADGQAAPAAGNGPAPGDAAPLPVGQQNGWELAFSDEFAGTSLNASNWVNKSSAEPDHGRGNLDNQQLEWSQPANCQVTAGQLVMTAKREPITSPSGKKYDWTSCMITTSRSYAFQYGYIEERSILPAVRGFWPAFWTWQAQGVDQHNETDVYEFYSDNQTRLYGTQYSGAQGRCDWKPPFNPTENWHTYGASILPTGTTWYVDGISVCQTAATAEAQTNIISNLAVYSKIPPEDYTTSATKRVDYIRAWKPAVAP